MFARSIQKQITKIGKNQHNIVVIFIDQECQGLAALECTSKFLKDSAHGGFDNS